MSKNFFISDYLEGLDTIKIADIGALMYDKIKPNYQVFIDNNIAEVIGFEPNPEEFSKLQTTFTSHTYLPYAVGNGECSKFYFTEMPGCSSLLEPNLKILGDFYDFPEWLKIKKEIEIQTHRLDEVLDGRDIDFIKIDIQGGELLALKDGIKTLDNSVVIEIEVEFIQQYKNQPLFSEIETFLRKHNFMFHTFLGYGTRSIPPIIKNNEKHRGFRQWIWSDAIFIKNLWNDNNLSQQKLLKQAVILNDLYNSYDLAYFALKQCDLKFNTSYSQKYLAAVEKFL